MFESLRGRQTQFYGGRRTVRRHRDGGRGTRLGEGRTGGTGACGEEVDDRTEERVEEEVKSRAEEVKEIDEHAEEIREKAEEKEESQEA